MSEFLPHKKRLLEEVYEKASQEATEQSFSGILKSLERSLLDDFKITLSYRTFETYYKSIVENEEDYNIKRSTLNDLSIYLGYENFKSYCLGWKTIEHTIQQAISKIVITIINKPLLVMPDFIKQNGFGIAGILIIGSVLLGNYKLPKEGKYKKEGGIGLGLFSDSMVDRNCMYWDGTEYKITSCEDRNPHREIIPIDTIKLNYFKKITRPDTLTVKNALGKVWYSKSDNVVEFFTMDGVNPDNDKGLLIATKHMLRKHAGDSTKQFIDFQHP